MRPEGISHTSLVLFQSIYYSVRKVSSFFSCENLVDFNEARFYEATVTFHTHAWIFSRLSTTSVDDKQHLSELVFRALVGFSLYRNMTVSGSYPYIQDSSSIIKVVATVCGVQLDFFRIFYRFSNFFIIPHTYLSDFPLICSTFLLFILLLLFIRHL